MPQKRTREYTGISSFLEHAASYQAYVTTHAAPPSRRQVKREAFLEKRKEIWRQKLAQPTPNAQEPPPSVVDSVPTAESALPLMPKMDPSRTLIVGQNERRKKP